MVLNTRSALPSAAQRTTLVTSILALCLAALAAVRTWVTRNRTPTPDPDPGEAKPKAAAPTLPSLGLPFVAVLPTTGTSCSVLVAWTGPAVRRPSKPPLAGPLAGLDFTPALPCEHPHHATAHRDEPACYVITLRCPRCRGVTTTVICQSALEELRTQKTLVHSEPDHPCRGGGTLADWLVSLRAL